MGQTLFSYSGITTKAKAMEAKLFDQDAYEEIIQTGSVREFVLYLKSKEAYRSYFEPMNENSVHRGQIEQVLKSALYQSFESLYQFADKNQQNQLDLLYLHYEITMLGECLKKLYSKSIDIDAGTFQSVLKNHIRIPVDALLNAQSFDEFNSLLRGTPYESVFEGFTSQNWPSLFDLLMHLNNYYYKTLWKRKSVISSKTQNEAFTKCIGTKIDVSNIMNIYRCKKYYQVEQAKIISILIPVSYRLTHDQLKELVSAGSIPEFITVLNHTDYRLEAETVTQDTMERDYYTRISRAYAKSKAKEPLSMMPIFNYLYQKERELDCLTTIVEGIRYGKKPEEIFKYLMNSSEIGGNSR